MNPVRIIQRLRSEDKPAKFILSRLLWKSGLCRLFKIKAQGYDLFFFPTALSCALWMNPKIRSIDDKFFLDYLQVGDCVVDVGANIGSLTVLAAAKVGPKGKIFAFEPHPKIYQFLLRNITLNKFNHVVSFNVGLGNKKTTAFLTNNSLDDMNKVVEFSANKKNVKTKMGCLDDFIHEKKINLLKIDTEGYEKYILQGAPQSLQRTDCVYIESSRNNCKNYGYSFDEVLECLRACDFQIYFNHARSLTEVINNKFPSDVTNLIAIKNLTDFINRTGYQIN